MSKNIPVDSSFPFKLDLMLEKVRLKKKTILFVEFEA
jgi:hypothetical protein